MKAVLAPHLGAKDILLGSRQELMRDARFLEPRILKAFLSRDGIYQLALGALRRKNWREALNKTFKHRYKRAYGLSSSVHPPAVDIRDAFPLEWSSYFRFCFVRNPYERVVSDYLYLSRKLADPPSFSRYLQNLAETGRDLHGRTKHDNWPMYTIENHLAVDFVGRYENLATDFQEVGRLIGLPDLALTASEKRRTYRKPWRDYYGPGDVDRVGTLYQKEIEAFGYRFEHTPAR